MMAYSVASRVPPSPSPFFSLARQAHGVVRGLTAEETTEVSIALPSLQLAPAVSLLGHQTSPDVPPSRPTSREASNASHACTDSDAGGERALGDSSPSQKAHPRPPPAGGWQHSASSSPTSLSRIVRPARWGSSVPGLASGASFIDGLVPSTCASGPGCRRCRCRNGVYVDIFVSDCRSRLPACLPAHPDVQ